MDNHLAYDRRVAKDFNEIVGEHKKVLEWVGYNKKVLEIACHTGYVSAWLQKRGCEVTGVEIYSPALEKAKPYLSRAILGNIEEPAAWQEIEKEQYDVILFMHILEHLVNPDLILSKAKASLKPGGEVIICLPNVSNWGDRFRMFKGDFIYTEIGVMDKTHLKFYNYFTAQEFIIKAGYNIQEYCGDGWKMRFKIFPEIKLLRRINDYYNRLIHKFAGPNFTDKVTMFRISIK
jgi:2-polyprenyl-3-methyl-5-hydroxy-6-metoxy-1,4-benzoquinol methylase